MVWIWRSHISKHLLSGHRHQAIPSTAPPPPTLWSSPRAFVSHKFDEWLLMPHFVYCPNHLPNTYWKQTLNSGFRLCHFIAQLGSAYGRPRDLPSASASPLATASVQAEVMVPELLQGQGAEATPTPTLLRSGYRNSAPCCRAQARITTRLWSGMEKMWEK